MDVFEFRQKRIKPQIFSTICKKNFGITYNYSLLQIMQLKTGLQKKIFEKKSSTDIKLGNNWTTIYNICQVLHTARKYGWRKSSNPTPSNPTFQRSELEKVWIFLQVPQVLISEIRTPPQIRTFGTNPSDLRGQDQKLRTQKVGFIIFDKSELFHRSFQSSRFQVVWI
eukprot:TRINITY_DN32665_c0_g3_i1.p2 TRINITY_DN32665_c0_g3~~TRINITY_DN32665_c0_g3_i1.p2  ORF type:complete len:168 (-),score=4.76 TRINITY_DN32665_c0_g3_i1:137-640(-)